MVNNDLIIQKANRLYRQNRFAEALQYYQKAGKVYGSDFVAVNISLCKIKIKTHKTTPCLDNGDLNQTHGQQKYITALEKQLEQTQSLAEAYYRELEQRKRKGKAE
ncbi:hypothetical protein [Salinimonas iocasae]|uniref:Tetratricopeptide repeat protein n=1 Tax=Salinimonas iocasae TaxID=2572577 RepID=A0A5B7YAG7_9ALTE|nr:hypothetical protein [Salinimonas iocasae]QCZ92405.1 hypothetical protein FBQ74_02430 [Salinimonas iocasae]